MWYLGIVWYLEFKVIVDANTLYWSIELYFLIFQTGTYTRISWCWYFRDKVLADPDVIDEQGYIDTWPITVNWFFLSIYFRHLSDTFLIFYRYFVNTKN